MCVQFSCYPKAVWIHTTTGISRRKSERGLFCLFSTWLVQPSKEIRRREKGVWTESPSRALGPGKVGPSPVPCCPRGTVPPCCPRGMVLLGLPALLRDALVSGQPWPTGSPPFEWPVPWEDWIARSQMVFMNVCVPGRPYASSAPPWAASERGF